MNLEQKKLLQDEINTFAQNIKDFETEKIDRKTFKGLSGGFGSYAQRNGGYMLRLRLSCGRLTKQRLALLADMIDDYQISLMKLTTCQTIQLHNLSADATVDLMKKALDAGIVTRGGGGDYPRNVMASPLSGVEKDEYFDVMPWAEGAAEYLQTILHDVHLPRKLKVAFSGSPSNVTHATFRDLGFVARKDGTFDVYCAGGLGPNPKLGVKVAESVAPKNVLACIDAMIEVFTTHGNYTNRGKSRTRYLQDTLGVDKLKEEYQKALAEKLQSSQTLSPQLSSEVTKEPQGELCHSRAVPQKQPGLYSVSYHPIGGILPVDMPRRLYEAIEHMPQVECRISPDGTIYIIHLTAEEAKSVLEITKDSAVTPFEHSVCCIGASICQQGLRDSQGMLSKVIKAVREADLPADSLPKIYISGCISSCGTHQIGTLGFQGNVKLADKKPAPAFTLLFHGNQNRGKERLGENMGVMLEENIPDFLVELGKMVADSGLAFPVWIEAEEEKFKELAKKYIDM